MHNHATEFITPTQFQLSLLLAIFKDCREFYPTRAQFDTDWRLISKLTCLKVLHREYKALNQALVAGELPFRPSSILANWTITPFSKPREVRAMRQLLGIFSRLEGFCSPDEALSGYATRVSNARGRLPDGIASIARDLVQTWLGPCPTLLELYPKHGPGAVAESIRDPREKAFFRYYYPQLDAVGGKALLYLNDRHAELAPRDLKSQRHPITKVVAVPKDFSKPRIISCEPTLMMFLQQAVAVHMMGVLEARCPYLRFRDQQVNQLLAKDHSCATLDMSNASDTVSRRLVYALFPPDWRRLLFSLRSHFSRLPNGTLVPLRAFAPMGSALCFPVESVVFAAMTVAIAINLKGPQWVKRKARSFAVYGDDIIAPIELAEDLIRFLPIFGFQPNEQKCCYKSTFRESCGAEWYGDTHESVTIVRPRTLNSTDTSKLDRSSSRHVMPMVQHANALYAAGFSCAARFLSQTCEFPVAIGKGDAYANSELPWPKPGQFRWNKHLQRLEQQSLLPVMGRATSDASTGYENLFLGLVSGWQSNQALRPAVVKPRTKWVLAAPLGDR